MCSNDDIIKHYSQLDYKYAEILAFLGTNGNKSWHFTSPTLFVGRFQTDSRNRQQLPRFKLSVM